MLSFSLEMNGKEYIMSKKKRNEITDQSASSCKNQCMDTTGHERATDRESAIDCKRAADRESATDCKRATDCEKTTDCMKKHEKSSCGKHETAK